MFEALARRAVGCNACFVDGRLQRPLVDIAQPRWVGPGYWSARPKVCIVALNPGGGSDRHAAANRAFLAQLRAFRDSGQGLAAVMEHQARDMPNWGRVAGRFTRFYFEGLGLDPQDVALANIAWCATSGDKYPDWMLGNCFRQHTGPLLKHLAPDVVLLSGSKTHRYAQAVAALLPNAQVLPMLHYAHRESPARELAELQRVREVLDASRSR